MIILSGWIKLHRQLLDSLVFDNPDLLKVWIWCLLKATHKGYSTLVGFQEVKLKEGQFIFGRTKAAEELSMSESKVYRLMKKLEEMGALNMKSNNKYTIVTIEKWRFYQGDSSGSEQQMNNKRTTNEQQMNTNKNVKNVKNIYISVFEHWNSKGIIRHRKLTPKMETKIRTALKTYTEDEIKEIIDNYAEILLDDKYWFSYKWTLEDFLQRGMTKFEDLEVAKENYLKDDVKIANDEDPYKWMDIGE